MSDLLLHLLPWIVVTSGVATVGFIAAALVVAHSD